MNKETKNGKRETERQKKENCSRVAIELGNNTNTIHTHTRKEGERLRDMQPSVWSKQVCVERERERERKRDRERE
jgi:hypothetical protein